LYVTDSPVSASLYSTCVNLLGYVATSALSSCAIVLGTVPYTGVPTTDDSAAAFVEAAAVEAASAEAALVEAAVADADAALEAVAEAEAAADDAALEPLDCAQPASASPKHATIASVTARAITLMWLPFPRMSFSPSPFLAHAHCMRNPTGNSAL